MGFWGNFGKIFGKVGETSLEVSMTAADVAAMIRESQELEQLIRNIRPADVMTDNMLLVIRNRVAGLAARAQQIKRGIDSIRT